ncbi:hypothetical protein MG293_001056 [Ovis ammon polii]|uniref:Uncharacterized protein n=1 Tax=Ovis ammon polii TaxID=230172 RepID=A0AAD4YIY5_OVIAM|nr:hypothetical protein MG293_001056 [Ovis ammon polii]
MCQILPKGAMSVLGPSSSPTSVSTVSQICGEKEIPHIKYCLEVLSVFKYILVTMDFPILHLDGVVEDSSNILGFSSFNTSQPFDPKFVHSLKVS